jgi:hypothetical protein
MVELNSSSGGSVGNGWEVLMGTKVLYGVAVGGIVFATVRGEEDGGGEDDGVLSPPQADASIDRQTVMAAASPPHRTVQRAHCWEDTAEIVRRL